MLMIRFQRVGRTNDPAFRISVMEKERAAKTGGILEQLGTYNPRSKAFAVDAEKVKGWMAKGAQLTGSVHNLFIEKGIIEGKKMNVLPKKTPPKKEEPVAEAAPAAEAAAPAEPAEAPAEESAPEAAPAEEAKPEEAPAA